ncbi:MAG: hypothetical protein ACYDA8_07750, partial [Deferrisomatales bacterium]
APEGPVGGVVSRTAGTGSLVLGLARGGTVRLPAAGPPLLDLGYTLAAQDGQRFTTLGAARWSATGSARDEYRVLAPFRPVQGGVPWPRLAPLLPAAARWLLPGPWAAPLSRWARRRGAGRPAETGLWLDRRIRGEASAVVVEDRLAGPLGAGERVSLCREGAGGFAPAARQGPGAGNEGWCREGLDASDAERLGAGRPLVWRGEL